MYMIVDCIPCQYGQHDDHHEVVQAVPEGVMGGAVCHCKGECVERYRKEQSERRGRPAAEEWAPDPAWDDFLRLMGDR